MMYKKYNHYSFYYDSVYQGHLFLNLLSQKNNNFQYYYHQKKKQA